MFVAQIKTMLKGESFSCETGGNWTSGKKQGVRCVAFGTCDIDPSTTRSKEGGTEQHQMDGGRTICYLRTEVRLSCCQCSREWRGKQRSWLESKEEKEGT